MPRQTYPETPDGRYFVARGRLWRKTNPALPEAERRAQVKALMRARNAVRIATKAEGNEAEGNEAEGDEVEGDGAAEREARGAVHAAKVALGERGPVWWTDGAPDENRHAPWNSSYAAWWDALDEHERERGMG